MNRQDDRDSEPGGRHYLHALRRKKWAVALTTLAVLGASIVVSLTQTPVYQAAADLLIKEPATSGSNSVFGTQTNQFPDVSALVGTQIQIVTSRQVRDAVLKQLGVAPRVAVSQIGSTSVIEISASSTSPRLAAAAANAWANSYIDFTRTQDINSDLQASTEIQAKVDDLQKQIDALPVSAQRDVLVTQQGLFKQRLNQLQVDASLRTGAAQMVTPASVPTTPSSPKPVRNAVLGLLVGLILGVGMAFLLDYFDDSVSSIDDVARATHGLPSLGLIPQIPDWKSKDEPQIVSVDNPTSPAAEAYRTLRTSIQFVGLDRAARIIQITSPNAAEGKTTTLSNLGVALANAGQRVCLCCCDLRRPRIHEFFGLGNSFGLTSAILGERSMSSAVQPVSNVEGLFLLASGPLPPNPSELLASPRAAEVIHALGASFDVVLIDCPPVLPVTDAAVLARVVDATLLTVTAGSTTGREISRTIQILGQVNAPLIGTILNGVTADTEGGYYRYYRYNRYGKPYQQDPRPPAAVVEPDEPFEPAVR